MLSCRSSCPPAARIRYRRCSGFGVVFMLMTFVVFAAYGLLAASARTRLLERPRLLDRMRRVFAASFVALGARLAVTAR